MVPKLWIMQIPQNLKEEMCGKLLNFALIYQIGDIDDKTFLYNLIPTPYQNIGIPFSSIIAKRTLDTLKNLLFLTCAQRTVNLLTVPTRINKFQKKIS